MKNYTKTNIDGGRSSQEMEQVYSYNLGAHKGLILKDEPFGIPGARFFFIDRMSFLSPSQQFKVQQCQSTEGVTEVTTTITSTLTKTTLVTVHVINSLQL